MQPNDPLLLLPPEHTAAQLSSGPTSCDVCGHAALYWDRCKLKCGNCQTIILTCADS